VGKAEPGVPQEGLAEHVRWEKRNQVYREKV
jgi:hypothetical protein